MIVFLPFESFRDSVRVLDSKRLWKQILECHQILEVLESRVKSRLTSHPGVKCWVGYEQLLSIYYNEAIIEWKVNRNHKTDFKLLELNGEVLRESNKPDFSEPWWLGQPQYHRAMRARLLSKYPEYYGKFFESDKGYNSGQYWYPIMDKNQPYRFNFYRQTDKLLCFRNGVIPQGGVEYIRVGIFNGRRNRVIFEDERYYRVQGTSEEDMILSEDYSDHSFRTSNGQFQFFELNDKSLFYKK